MTTLELTPSRSGNNWFIRGSLIGLVLVIFFALLYAISAVLPTRPGTITLKTSGFQFSEMEIRVQAGQSVNLELFNTDGYAHAFDIDAFDIHIPLQASETIPFAFTPTEPGIYQFYCGALGHREAGMVGTLVVEP